MNPPRILVVDDTPDLLELFSTVLGQTGYEVLRAENAAECLRIVHAVLPDLVLLDVMLPDLSGIEVCRRIKADPATAGMLVIHVSGMRTSGDNAAEGLEAGADGYLVKPVEPRELVAHVNALLRLKETEQALKQSEEQFETAFDNALDAMLIADDQANYVDANPAACELFGVARDEMLKRNLSDFVEPVQRPAIEKVWQTFIAEGEQQGYFRLYRPDGAIRDLEYRAKANFLPHRHLSILRDVTERKQAEEALREAHDELEKRVEQRTAEIVAANSFLKNEIIEHRVTEQALRESEEHVRLMVNGIKDYAIFMLDTEGRITSWNEGAARLKGYRSDEIIGKDLSLCFSPQDIRHSKTERVLTRAVAEERYEDECWMIRKDGSRFWANLIITPLRDEQGHLRGFVNITRDITERKQDAEALRKAKEALQTIFDAAPVAILGLDLEGQITNWSSGAEQMFGWDSAETIGRLCLTVPEDGLVDFRLMIDLVARQGPQTGMVYVRQKKNRERIHCSISSAPLRDNTGTVTGVMVILEDITELKKHQEELRCSEEQYRELVENINDILYATDAQGTVTYISQAIEYSTGAIPSEIIGRPFSEFIHPEDLSKIIESFQQSAAGQVKPSEFRIFDRSGDIHWLRKSSRPVFHGERFVGTRGLLTDITDRKGAEEKLQATNETLRTLIQASPLGIVGVDPSGNVTMWNRAAEIIFGWSEEELLGGPLPFVLGEKKDEHRALREKVLRGESSTDVEVRRIRKDGSPVSISLSTGPTRDAEGRIIGMIEIMADIMDRKQIEEERAELLRRLVTAQEEERRRLSRELHDQMGQSIAALMLGLKSLGDSGQFQTFQNDQLRQLRELTNQLARDVHHLASSLRPTALDDLGLHTALSNYVEEWADRTNITADFHSNGLIKQRLDQQVETTVYRIVQEALTNVLKHAKAQNVSIIVEHRGNRLMAIVEDDGCGFEADAMLNKPASERGLGLLGMRERVSLVGGSLEIESTPGTGTTLLVHIPAS
jgi:PAS domain S-box-containing protein